MLRLLRQSFLAQLLGGYLLFMAVLLGGGLALNATVQQHLLAGSRAADLALAATVAREASGRIDNARMAVSALANREPVRRGDLAGMGQAFAAFLAARPDVDRVYWLDRQGLLRLSLPDNPSALGTDFSNQQFFQRGRRSLGPLVEAGAVEPTTLGAIIVAAQPVRDEHGQLIGVVAANLALDDLSASLRALTNDQARQSHSVLISLVDDKGRLIASPEPERLLQPVLDALPGARAALAGAQAAELGPGPHGQEWLFSAAPVPGVGWAVVVQRPAATIFAAITPVQTWFGAAVAFGALGGLALWLVLRRRVIGPLDALTARYDALSAGHPAPPSVAACPDEFDALTRTLGRLESEMGARLARLHTLLETATAVVSPLDPALVAETMLSQARRLVDAQGAAVLVCDEHDALRVLASMGCSADYDLAVRIPPDDLTSPAAIALREGRLAQMSAGTDESFPPEALAHGFHTLLAIPIAGPHLGGVVLLVSRTAAQPFTPDELDLLLAFAKHAALAWEHAVLYERSDRRLRTVAQENERLYREALRSGQCKSDLLAAVNHETRPALARNRPRR